ncbi:MAG: hypothetical protein QM572_03755 [Nocardioides sp.]|uniref:YobI family P-loop NTPase n=1 Tax=Nocardioides sp. TaxID=35761 RepID=UPI0039E3C7D7
MPDNVIAESADGTARLGQRLRLTSLAPLFDKDRHQLYFDLLVRAIGAKGVRNIALTGAYGTGKSSVLEQLGKIHTNRVIELSLSTIAPEIHDASDSQEDAGQYGSGSRTNLIQKEIVKQLLYRLSPGAVPRSRFRRANAPDKFRDWKLAGVIGAAVFAVLLLLGLLQPHVSSLFPAAWRQVVAYLLLFGSAVCAAWVVIILIRGRPTLSASVQSGPATITLSKASDTYFDEYLDEIVYFFQASRRDIVVIEDIDRFEDVQVFDTLRALNGLLNSSDQIGRRIVFIYAIRDSVFEQIGAKDDGDDGALPPDGDSDRAKETLKRASRTKFFDVIIPVVPFVSADNARDVMSQAMRSEDFEVDPALIRLAARHVADMRMIHNIRNEFEVYRSRLVVPRDRIPGINDDLVFAIVLFKNTHLADFEKIRYRDSTLDHLYAIWRALVQENLAKQARQLTAQRQRRHLEATSDARAASLGHRLEQFRDTLQAAARAAVPQASVELSGPATDTSAEDVDTWTQIASGESQQLRLHDPNNGPYYSSTINLAFSAEQLASLLGLPVEPEEWLAIDVQDVDERIAKAESNIRFLRHHTWEDLSGRPEFEVNTTPFELTDSTGRGLGERTSFDEVIESVLESDLARELVRHGFLTSHFALYASSYYGNHLGPEALEYIRRCIEPGLPDTFFAMSEADVIQLLREQGAEKSDEAELFSDPSVFNVSILDYLLSKRPAAAETVARRLSTLGEPEREFVDAYVSQGQHPAALLAAIAPRWKEILKYAAVDAPVDGTARPALLDAVLRVLPTSQFDVDQAVGHVLESNYQDIAAINDPGSTARAKIVMEVVQASGAVVESLEALNAAAQGAAVQLRLFPITEANLRVLVPTGVIALDVLRSNRAAYQYALDRIEDYLALVAGSSGVVRTVADPKMFATVLTDAAKRSSSTALGELVNRSSVDCRVTDLHDVAAGAWPLLAAGNRTDPTFENVSAYLEQVGMDTHLASLLNKHKKITGFEKIPVDQRKDIATTVLAASNELPSTALRVRIAASIKPGTIAASSIVPERSDLIAKLLRRRLLADDATAFSSNLMLDWPTLEQTIAASKKYATFVSPDLLEASNIPNLLRSAKVSQEIKLTVASQIATHLTNASTRQTQAIAAALIDTRWRMPYESLEALRNAGANPAQVIALIAARAETLPTDEIKTLLRSLGGGYARIATGGRGRPTFRVDDAHQYVLNRLVGDTIKQVGTETFKLKGRRLVATLRSSS